MLTSPISFDKTMRELFEYPDPSFPFVVWSGDFCSFAGQAMACHWHEEFEYGVLLSGALDYNIDGQRIHVKQGDAIFINANIIHMAAHDARDDTRIFTVSFLPSLLSGGGRGKVYEKYFLPILQSGIKGFCIRSATRDGKAIIELLRNLFRMDGNPPRSHELLCLSITSMLWSATIQYAQEHECEFVRLHKERDNEAKAKDVLQYIHDHYAESVRIDTIAQKTGISRSEVFRCFQKYTNRSPIEYLTEYRLAHAANKLLETDKTVTQIALACGFSSTSYFGKVFRQKYASSPTHFKETLSSVGVS